MKKLVMIPVLALVVCVLRADMALGLDDAKDLKGAWKVESAKRGGEDSDEPVGDIVKIDGKSMEVESQDGDGPGKIAYKIDPSKKPKHIDMTFDAGGMDITIEAVYELKDDTLKICMGMPGGERPKKVDSEADTETFLLVMKRVKK